MRKHFITHNLPARAIIVVFRDAHRYTNAYLYIRELILYTQKPQLLFFLYNSKHLRIEFLLKLWYDIMRVPRYIKKSRNYGINIHVNFPIPICLRSAKKPLTSRNNRRRFVRGELSEIPFSSTDKLLSLRGTDTQSKIYNIYTFGGM